MNKQTDNTVEIELSMFTGFYESIHNDIIDNYIDSMEYDFDRIDYKETYKAYAENYVNEFESAFNSDSELPKQTFEFVELVSPKFYNFSTDRIFMKVDLSLIKKIWSMFNGSKELLEYIKDKCTSYDGFASFYSNDLFAWREKGFDKFDEVELSLIFDFYVSEWLNFEEDDFIDNIEIDLIYSDEVESV